MSAGDPGHASGNQTYPNPSPDCECDHPEIMHKLFNGKRTRCGVGSAAGQCDCRRYMPKEEP